jgi:RimJ/RimL family protein N-acetyltransferase
LGWVNDPLVRKNAFEGSLISPESHHRWLVSKLKDKENCMLFVIETLEELPIGQVRFECNGTQWEIHYGLWAPIRGLGLGTKMLAEALSVFRQTKSDVTLFGRVKRDNFPSRRIFEALGFKKKSEEHFLVYHQST